MANNERFASGKFRRPDWATWTNLPTFIVWEAVALSLDISPDKIQMVEDGWIAGPGHFLTHEGPTFDNRLLVATRNLRQAGPLRPHAPLVEGEPAKCGVDAREFVKWAMSIGWDLPPEMRSIGERVFGQESWPWGDHETPYLRHLAQAAREWWSTYDPADPTTAPTNEEVSNWLIERGVSKRMAEVMAQMLRAEDVPTGRRPKPE